MGHNYNQEYARKYIETTLSSPYTVYKNRLIARIFESLETGTVWDLGGNVSGLIRQEGSLRLQVEKVGIAYRTIDLVPEYFCPEFAQSLGVKSDHIFPGVAGAVGDMQCLPVASNALEAVVSADVIEHIPNPALAIAEVARVLRPTGVAVIVVPSLYKLDAIHPEHVEKKRYSSHENKFTYAQWKRMLSESGLELDEEKSRPLGVLSGLLYLAWLDERFVPAKSSQDSQETYSPAAKLFKNVKKMMSAFDQRADDFFLNNPGEMNILVNYLKEGRIFEVFLRIKQLFFKHLDAEQSRLFQSFLEELSSGVFCPRSLERVQELSRSTSGLFLGNSVVFVATKPHYNIDTA